MTKFRTRVTTCDLPSGFRVWLRANSETMQRVDVAEWSERGAVTTGVPLHKSPYASVEAKTQ